MATCAFCLKNFPHVGISFYLMKINTIVVVHRVLLSGLIIIIIMAIDKIKRNESNRIANKTQANILLNQWMETDRHFINKRLFVLIQHHIQKITMQNKPTEKHRFTTLNHFISKLYTFCPLSHIFSVLCWSQMLWCALRCVKMSDLSSNGTACKQKIHFPFSKEKRATHAIENHANLCSTYPSVKIRIFMWRGQFVGNAYSLTHMHIY